MSNDTNEQSQHPVSSYAVGKSYALESEQLPLIGKKINDLGVLLCDATDDIGGHAVPTCQATRDVVQERNTRQR